MGFGVWALIFALLASVAPRVLVSQERGAVALGDAVMGLGVNARVLLIGAHPDDEDTFLISWLSRGRHVETAYLSLTRGDGGQNLIGNELGEALGVIRTEELLAARRVDGARQYFTRAYDFGYSKDTVDTYKHWPKDAILGDIVEVIRAFRPHVIVAVFSGTARDGHGHHQVSGLLAREAYDVAGDTTRYPPLRFGNKWTPLKFYRAARFNPEAGTLSLDVGEYSPLLGRSYAEIAGESRSQHKSQGFGALQRKGPVFDFLRREATRVNESVSATSERSLFDGIDTTWTRFRSLVTEPNARAALDSLPSAFQAAQSAFHPFTPSRLVSPLARVQRLLSTICHPERQDGCEVDTDAGTRVSDRVLAYGDLLESLDVALSRVSAALTLAADVELEALALREDHPLGAPARITTTTYNRGSDTVVVGVPSSSLGARRLPPGAALVDTIEVHSRRVNRVDQPYWLDPPRVGALFTRPIFTASETQVGISLIIAHLAVSFPNAGGASVEISAPVVYRFADPVRGELRRPVAVVPAISVTLDRQVQYVPANSELDLDQTVGLSSADDQERDVRVRLALPRGLAADSVSRTVRLSGYGSRQAVTSRIRGRLPVGVHRIAAFAESDGRTFSNGYELIDYEHIRARRIYRPAITTISAVDVQVPAKLRVAYVTGVGDNVAPMLAQLGIPLTIIPADELARTDLRAYTTVAIGPRAYEAHPALVAANRRLLDFVQAGGTLLVQYGQYEMMQPGIMPYPVSLARPASRVAHEDAAVAIVDRNAPELRAPNPIGERDFTGWVQERALYMPFTFDDRYRSLLAMSDAGEPPNRGAILVARLGKGTYVYTTLSFFRQLPAGVPGAARLFVNLLSAGMPTASVSP